MMEYNVIPILICILLAGAIFAAAGYLIGYMIERLALRFRRKHRDDGRV